MMAWEWGRRVARRAALVVAALCAIALAGCGRPSMTYAYAVATAQASGCWPGNRLPPAPVTVTLPGGVSPTPTATAPSGVASPAPGPTGIALPTTTPLPRCTPGPGETQESFPTLLPTHAPYPTQQARERGGGSVPQTVLRVPSAALSLDLAVHPGDGWPAVAAIDVPLISRDGARVYGRVFNPLKRRWGPAQTLDVGAGRLGDTLFRSVAVAVAADGTVHAVWGVTPYPALEIYHSLSRDHGETWSAPERVGGGYFRLLDAVTLPDGSLVVLAMPRRPTGAQFAAVLTRSPGGQWRDPELIDAPTWYAADGAMTVVGAGADVRLVALITGEGPHVYLATRLAASGAWEVGRRSLTPLPGLESGRLPANVQGVAFDERGVAFVFGTREAAELYAVVTLDAGETWSGTEAVMAYGATSGPSDPQPQYAAISFDARASRLVAVWTCCKEALFGNAESTHYASWSEPGSGVWLPRLVGAHRRVDAAPLISGAVAAGLTVGAQAPNSDDLWLAWVEDGTTVALRTFDLHSLLPMADYPTPTVAPSPTGG
jgi:hypothetical protein